MYVSFILRKICASVYMGGDRLKKPVVWGMGEKICFISQEDERHSVKFRCRGYGVAPYSLCTQRDQPLSVCLKPLWWMLNSGHYHTIIRLRYKLDQQVKESIVCGGRFKAPQMKQAQALRLYQADESILL